MRTPKKYAFVVPRYFEGIAGGAETLSGKLGTHLQARGDKVEILTTCAKDHRTWENYYSPGWAQEGQLQVLRCPVDERDLSQWIPLQIRLCQGERLSIDEELIRMRESVNSLKLYEEIVRRAHLYDALFFGPYLFGTTFWGAQLVPEKSILIPCLHDENDAYTSSIEFLFSQVRGCLFNAEGERSLAERLYGSLPGGVVGIGFEPFTESTPTPFFPEPIRYVLYFGRKEGGKNVPLLIDCFIHAKSEGNTDPSVKLVIAGGGDFADLHRPEALQRDDIIDIPYVTEEQKLSLIAHADYVCQPSVNESFSIVLMEAWRLKKPVLVHEACDVTRIHVIDSGGGLYFSGKEDFAAVHQYLVSHEEERALMGKNGCQYVEEKYSWPAVLERFDTTVENLLSHENHTLSSSSL